MLAVTERKADLLNLAGSLSLTAALIHFAVTPQHFEEWWGYGLFFLIAASAQLVYGLMLLSRAWGIPLAGVLERQWSNHQEFVYALGMIGNTALVALYIVTRTIGIPLGPSAGQLEDLSLISIGSKAVELLLVLCLEILRRSAEPAPLNRSEVFTQDDARGRYKKDARVREPAR